MMEGYSRQNKQAWENERLPGEFTAVAVRE